VTAGEARGKDDGCAGCFPCCACDLENYLVYHTSQHSEGVTTSESKFV